MKQSTLPGYAVVRIRGRSVPQESIINQNDYLIHFGIKGQKWGLRRYQNEDGTLTEEGKKRYNENPESETWEKSEAERLTDEELRRRNNRLQAEQQYRNLTTREVERERKQFKQEFKKKVLTAALITPVVAVIGILGKRYISNHSEQIGNLISRVGKTTVSKIKSLKSNKGLLKRSASKYTHPHGSRGMLTNSGSRINSTNRLYNYRPQKWNLTPREHRWPSSGAGMRWPFDLRPKG